MRAPELEELERVRRGASLLVVAAVGAIAGPILGEYSFTGVLPWVAGPLLGLLLGELAVTVGRWRGLVPTVVAAAAAAGGLLWAGWLSSSSGRSPYPALAVVAAALAAVIAVVRIGPWRSAERQEG